MLKAENVDSSSFWPRMIHVVVLRNVLLETPSNFVTYRVSIFALPPALSVPRFCASVDAYKQLHTKTWLGLTLPLSDKEMRRAQKVRQSTANHAARLHLRL
jgi:hypothetical protein